MTIRALTYDNNSLESSVDSLPFVQRILYAKYCERIKASASDMLFRKMLDLDSGLFVPKEERQPASPTDTISSYMTKLHAMQDSIIKIAVENSLLVDSQHMTSKTSDPFVFEIGSFVLVHYNDGTPPTRLHTVWMGPMRVQKVQDSTYVLEDLVTHKEDRFHSSKMKPFLFYPLVVN